MKVAVINFSGNVGKTTIAGHLLVPRIDGAELIAVETINADEGQAMLSSSSHHENNHLLYSNEYEGLFDSRY